MAKELGLSMPTVLTNVNELIAKGLIDRKSTRLNSSHVRTPRMPSSA